MAMELEGMNLCLRRVTRRPRRRRRRKVARAQASYVDLDIFRDQEKGILVPANISNQSIIAFTRKIVYYKPYNLSVCLYMCVVYVTVCVSLCRVVVNNIAILYVLCMYCTAVKFYSL